MPVGTSDGQHFEDEFSYAASQLGIDEHTGDPLIPLKTQDAYDDFVEGPEAMPVKHLATNYNINVKNWDAMLSQTSPSQNIEDRRNSPYDPVLEADVQDSETLHNILDAKPVSKEEIDSVLQRQNRAKMRAGAEIPSHITQTPADAGEPVKIDPQEAFNVGAQRIAKSVLKENKPERDIPIANAVLRLGGGLLDFAKFPGKVYKGEVDLQSEEGRKQSADWAAAMALNMVFTPAPLASKAIDGTLGSIAGIKAAVPKETNINWHLANQMEAKGMPTNQIWDATGWYRGVDNKWRTELPSENAKILIPPKDAKNMTLPDVLHFPELYEAYPQLRKVKFELNPASTYLGSFEPGSNTIQLNAKMHKELGNNPMDTLLHEVQHKIQDIEGFPNGTNPTAAYHHFIKDLHETADRIGSTDAIVESWLLEDRASKVKEQIGNKLYYNNIGEREARITEMRKDPGMRKESPKAMQERMDASEEAFKRLQEKYAIDNLNSPPPKGWESAASPAREDLTSGMGMLGAVSDARNTP